MKTHVSKIEIDQKVKKPPNLYRLSLIIWFVFCVLITAFIINDDLDRARKQFQLINSGIIEHISDRILIAETALEGFASHIQEDQKDNIDHLHLSRVASNLLQRYPFLYMFEVAQRIDGANRQHKEEEFASIYPGFHIRQFDYDNTRQWIVSEKKASYFPIIFQEPFFQDHRNILGLDLTSSDVLANAMEASNKKGIAIASEPFILAENIKGYVIHRAVSEDHGFQPEPLSNKYYALLAISSDKMFNLASIVDSRMFFSIEHPGFKQAKSTASVVFEKGEREKTDKASFLFPVLTYSKDLNNLVPSQPFIYSSQLQLSWIDYSIELLSILIALSVLLPIAARGYIHEYLTYELMKLEDKDELYRLANFDPLTGLPNRTRLFEYLEMLIARAMRDGSSFTVFFIDVDNFKLINDQYGHSTGDDILCELSARLSAHIRENEMLARLGGDEFILVSDKTLSPLMINTIINRIIKLFDEPVIHADQKINVKLSIGESTFPHDGKSMQVLLEKADQNMYIEKRKNKDTLKIIKSP